VKIDPKQTLIEHVATFALDPLGFVLFAFPWGEAGAELADATGPRDWQRELLAGGFVKGTKSPICCRS
jgi:hypothetical protein